MKLWFLDTEFYNTANEYVTPVCASILDGEGLEENHDTRTRGGVDMFAASIRNKLNSNDVFVSYAFEAEARFMQACGVNPLKEDVRCIDLYILYRLLANRFDCIQYGKHIVQGRIVSLIKPLSKWEKEEQIDEDEEDDEEGSKSRMEYGLVSATFKFLNEVRDSEDKKNARDRILKGGPFTQEEFNWILRYCYDDTKFLPKLYAAMLTTYKRLVPGASIEKLIGLSRYAINTAEMVRVGYCIQPEWLDRVVKAVPMLLRDEQRKLLKLSDTMGLDFRPLTYKRGEDRFKENQKEIKDYVLKKFPNCVKTKTGPCLKEEPLWNLAQIEGEGSFLWAFSDFRWTCKALKSFITKTDGKSKTKPITAYIGSDGRCRPYFGIYGAQTSRSQPSSSSYIFLKASCLRHLVHPKPGKIMFGIDYSSQEFLINAILAEDENMLAAYQSGDPYLWLAKAFGMVPQNGTKESHKPQRNKAKGLELGLSYGMGAPGVSLRSGMPLEEARDLMQRRAEIYRDLTRYRRELQRDYEGGDHVIVLPDGWAHGPGNPNMLSVLNAPTQGHGAVVMRRAVDKCQRSELCVTMTLHDALYFECWYDEFERHLELANKIMIESFAEIMKFRKVLIRTECHAWGDCFPERREEKPRHTKNGVEYMCEKMFWEDGKVSAEVRDKWHGFVLQNSIVDKIF